MFKFIEQHGIEHPSNALLRLPLAHKNLELGIIIEWSSRMFICLQQQLGELAITEHLVTLERDYCIVWLGLASACST